MMNSRALVVPACISDSIKLNLWPAGRVPAAAFPFLNSRRLAGLQAIEFATSEDEILAGDSEQADTKHLIQFSTSSRLASEFRLYRGSADSEHHSLPWLDVEKALIIGCGADYGDDLWIVLDYRHNALAPKVVLNRFEPVPDGRYMSFRAVWEVGYESAEELVEAMARVARRRRIRGWVTAPFSLLGFKPKR